ncbi:MAG TPA: transcription termination/antitermination NusG family protein [Verrucomicrobiae bacterium]
MVINSKISRADSAAHSGASKNQDGMDEAVWFVAHTRPRCEKKLAKYCGEKGLAATLPCYSAAHKYRGKTVVFQKPLFPGYVFLRIRESDRGIVKRSDHAANLLEVFDQETLGRQLEDILRALETNLEIRLAPAIGEGSRVKIKFGSLRGMDGWVEKRHGMNTVLLRLDFIGQAAAVQLEATDLELI